jgi:hypothetical protein
MHFVVLPLSLPLQKFVQLFFCGNRSRKLLYDWRSVSQSICLGVEPTLGLVTRYYFMSEGCCLKVAVLFLWGALSDEFAVQSLSGSSGTEPVTKLHCLIWKSRNLEGKVPVFISPRNRAEPGSLYVASYDSQGYSGGILTLPIRWFRKLMVNAGAHGNLVVKVLG